MAAYKLSHAFRTDGPVKWVTGERNLQCDNEEDPVSFHTLPANVVARLRGDGKYQCYDPQTLGMVVTTTREANRTRIREGEPLRDPADPMTNVPLPRDVVAYVYTDQAAPADDNQAAPVDFDGEFDAYDHNIVVPGLDSDDDFDMGYTLIGPTLDSQMDLYDYLLNIPELGINDGGFTQWQQEYFDRNHEVIMRDEEREEEKFRVWYGRDPTGAELFLTRARTIWDNNRTRELIEEDARNNLPERTREQIHEQIRDECVALPEDQSNFSDHVRYYRQGIAPSNAEIIIALNLIAARRGRQRALEAQEAR